MAQRVDNAYLWCHTDLAMRRRMVLRNLHTSWGTTLHLRAGLHCRGPKGGIGTPSPLWCFMQALLAFNRVSPLRTHHRDERLRGWLVMADSSTREPCSMEPWGSVPCLEAGTSEVRATSCRACSSVLGAGMEAGSSGSGGMLTGSSSDMILQPGDCPQELLPQELTGLVSGAYCENATVEAGEMGDLEATHGAARETCGCPGTAVAGGRLVATCTPCAGLVGQGPPPGLYCSPNQMVPLSWWGGTEADLAPQYTQRVHLPGSIRRTKTRALAHHLKSVVKESPGRAHWRTRGCWDLPNLGLGNRLAG